LRLTVIFQLKFAESAQRYLENKNVKHVATLYDSRPSFIKVKTKIHKHISNEHKIGSDNVNVHYLAYSWLSHHIASSVICQHPSLYTRTVQAQIYCVLIIYIVADQMLILGSDHVFLDRFMLAAEKLANPGYSA